MSRNVLFGAKQSQTLEPGEVAWEELLLKRYQGKLLACVHSPTCLEFGVIKNTEIRDTVLKVHVRWMYFTNPTTKYYETSATRTFHFYHTRDPTPQRDGGAIKLYSDRSVVYEVYDNLKEAFLKGFTFCPNKHHRRTL